MRSGNRDAISPLVIAIEQAPPRKATVITLLKSATLKVGEPSARSPFSNRTFCQLQWRHDTRFPATEAARDYVRQAALDLRKLASFKSQQWRYYIIHIRVVRESYISCRSADGSEDYNCQYASYWNRHIGGWNNVWNMGPLTLKCIISHRWKKYAQGIETISDEIALREKLYSYKIPST